MRKENLTLIQRYHDEAKAKLWKQYHVDKNNKMQGEEKWWYDNGQISLICNYKDGNWHGKYQDWYYDGRRTYIDTNHSKKTEHGTRIEFKYGK